MTSLINRVAEVMGKIAPLCLADNTWDNVGVLVESPASNNSGVVVLTIDLTPEVMEECLRLNAEVIVAYHPPIFSPFKRLTLGDPRQKIILQTIRHGVSIYCPHTSLDAASGGINDWLASIVDPDGTCCPISPCDHIDNNPKGADGDKVGAVVGMGRVVSLSKPKAMDLLVLDIKRGLALATVRVSLPDRWSRSTEVRRVAICAGSGSGVFKGLKEDVDVLLTGEMGHHDVLAANAKGFAVILCEHTNTERGYLDRVLLPSLQASLGSSVRVITSAFDKDPLVVW